jgi:spore germination protein GerM
MRKRPLYIGLAGLTAGVVAILLWAVVRSTSVESPPQREAFADPAAETTEMADGSGDPSVSGSGKDIAATYKEPIHLYFVAADSRHLVAETRTVMRSADPVTFGRQIILALLEGPRSTAGRSLPEETQLRAFFLGEDGTAYLDLAETVSRQHPGGVTLERLSIYSLVNSLVLNCEAVKTVRILIEGREVQTLAGHVDLQRAFNANMLIIK